MFIHTTINIRQSLQQKLSEVASLFNITKSEIIVLIILKTMHKSKIKPCLFRTVRYQAKDKYAKWKNCHVSLNKDIYEIGLDLRKVTKLSVSRIVSEGILEFLDEIIKELSEKNIKGDDNYVHDYIFSSNYYEDIFYFSIFWGIPPEKILKNYL